MWHPHFYEKVLLQKYFKASIKLNIWNFYMGRRGLLLATHKLSRIFPWFRPWSPIGYHNVWCHRVPQTCLLSHNAVKRHTEVCDQSMVKIWLHIHGVHECEKQWPSLWKNNCYKFSFSKEALSHDQLRTVPTIVTAHTFCTSWDTRVSYGWCLLIQGYFVRFKTMRRKQN